MQKKVIVTMKNKDIRIYPSRLSKYLAKMVHLHIVKARIDALLCIQIHIAREGQRLFLPLPSVPPPVKEDIE